MSRPIQVMKFGGTSVGDAGRIRSAAAIAAEASKERAVVVVVSAMSGVTNTLIAAAGKAATGDEAAAEALTRALQDKTSRSHRRTDFRHRKPAANCSSEIDALIERAANYCRGCALLGELSPRALDVIAGTGERLTARMAAAVLREMGCRGVAFDATDLIVTDEVHGGARPLADPTRDKNAGGALAACSKRAEFPSSPATLPRRRKAFPQRSAAADRIFPPRFWARRSTRAKSSSGRT